MSTVAIIQARMGSTRLPGKVLMDIGGRPMLERVVLRTGAASLVDRVVVATTSTSDDDAIVDLCRSIGAAWFRGSVDDVLDRYRNAAVAFDAETVVRITSDCPLIDPTVIGRVIGAFHSRGPDYASNCIDRTYPRGLDTEVFTRAALERAWCEASDPPERIHVTPYLYRHPERFALLSVTAELVCEDLRWTVDTQLDLEVVRDIYRCGENADHLGWKQALAAVRADPDRLNRNRSVRQKTLEEG
jgi:spore coat polysaccharide biosynthesis protein SpsF